MKSTEYLLRLKVTYDCVDTMQNFLDKWHNLTNLNLNKVTTAFLCYFDECIACHVLNAIVCFCTNNMTVISCAVTTFAISPRVVPYKVQRAVRWLQK